MKNLFRIPMQFFAEDPAPPADPEPGKDPAKDNDPKPTPQPAPAPAPQPEPAPDPDAPSADELAEFRKWQESKRTDAEKHAAAISKAEKARTAAEERAAAAELKLTALSKGVTAEALDDVIALAKTKISDKVTAEQAIADIIKKYPAFGSASITNGTDTNNQTPNPSADDAKARRIMGLPEKK